MKNFISPRESSVLVSHHLNDETLLDYANGALTASMETVVACHLTACPHCRGTNQLADEIGGELLEEHKPVSVKLTAVQLLAQASTRPANNVSKSQTKVGDRSIPAPLARLLPSSVESLDWKNLAPGIKQYNLSTRPKKEGAFKLLRLEPGVNLSQHTHNERELTFVVRGSYHDKLGHFRAGDIADLDSDVEHRPIVDDSEVCIALIATDAPVRYSTMMGKMMQPFVGI